MLGDRPIATIDTTMTGDIGLEFSTRRTSTDEILSSSPPYTLSLHDDVDGSLIVSGITVSSARWSLPEQYRNTIGVYRIRATDST
jgi:hypothetical protein